MVWTTNSGYFKSRVHFPARNTECIKRAHTLPINCNIIAHKDTMILYMFQTSHPFNSPVLTMFILSGTILAMLRYSEVTDKYSPQYGRWWISLYFMSNIFLLNFFDPFQLFSQPQNQLDQLPSNHLYQQFLFPFPVIHLTSPFCNLN